SRTRAMPASSHRPSARSWHPERIIPGDERRRERAARHVAGALRAYRASAPPGGRLEVELGNPCSVIEQRFSANAAEDGRPPAATGDATVTSHAGTGRAEPWDDQAKATTLELIR